MLWWEIIGLCLSALLPWSLAFSQHEICIGAPNYLGDGFCDNENNDPSCDYDRGDCCICTCIDNSECSFTVFDCLNPEAGHELHGCEAPPTTAPPCDKNVQSSWVVEDSVQAHMLADAINCSDGMFDVEWRGVVEMGKTIYIGGGTVVSISGTEPSANIHGSFGRRLFTVVNASLYLKNITVSSGASIAGGAIASSASNLTFDRTSFIRNNATGVGGALFVSDGSRVSLGGKGSTFLNNTATGDGGALYVSGGSNVLVDGETVSFLSNTAGGDGGAIAVRDLSFVSWSEGALFSNNSCRSGGGALDVYGGSRVSWAGTTLFSYNNASFGGAIFARVDSNTSWSGETTFIANNAGDGGGAYVGWNSTVSWAGETVFISNEALRGGALHVTENSNISWSGETTLTANSAEYGGAMYIANSSFLSWAGNTTFGANKAAGEDYGIGGAMFVLSNSGVTFTGNTSFDRNSASGATFGAGGAFFVVSSSISWSGETTFFGNTAEFVGGALGGVSAAIFWNGPTAFLYNSASLSGGAIYAHDSQIWWSEDTNFGFNQANFAGGAISISTSNLSWSLRTDFTSNLVTADGGSSIYRYTGYTWIGGSGGAIYAFNSSMSWSGDTEFGFNRVAGAVDGGGGGALSAHASHILWNGNTVFVSNQCDDGGFGGALQAFNKSTVSWCGKTLFLNNTGVSGGAVGVMQSNISWGGPTIFLNNSCGWIGGGLLVLSDSRVEWNGDSTFSNNMARFGGGIYFSERSALAWTGRTEFAHNTAERDGGAVGSVVTGSQTDETISTLIVAETTAFFNNTCGENGGALALTGRLFVNFQARNTTFLGNSASVAGGAVYLSGADLGPQLHNVSFVSNSAKLGGGVYATSSGNAKMGITGEEEPNPTTFEGCVFIGNKAEATGGAIHTAAGQDVMFDTSFVGNKAGVGGALRLAGTASLDSCSFVDNVSDEEGGPAVSNIGYILNITGILFADNVYNCSVDTFLDYGSSGDAYRVVCDGCDTTCRRCRFEEPTLVPRCTTVMDHCSSPGGLTTLETITIDRGYWRAKISSVEVLPCYNPDVCLGGVTGAPRYCRGGYEGPYCAICSGGYSASLGYTCKKCRDKLGGIVMAVLLVVAGIIIIIIFARYLASAEWESSQRGMVDRVTQYVPVQSLKIVVVAWQILTQFVDVANVTFPNIYERFLDGVKVLNFDLGWILSIGCVLDLDFHGRLLFATVGPIIVVALLAATYALAVGRNRGSVEALRKVRHKHVSVFLVLTFLVYSSVSSVLFQNFACERVDDGKYYLRADYRIECDSPRHVAFQIYAGFMTVLYTVGIPLLYVVLLFKDRDVLRTDEADREDNQRIRSTSQLWKPYKSSVFYYEVIECGRRILLTGVVVFIYPNTAAQIAVTLILAFTFAMVSEGLNPYVSRWDTWVSRVGHVVVFVSMYLALLLKVNVSAERSESQEVFEVILVLAHGGLIVAVMVEALALVCSSFKEGRRRVLPSPPFRCTRLLPWNRGGVSTFSQHTLVVVDEGTGRNKSRASGDPFSKDIRGLTRSPTT